MNKIRMDRLRRHIMNELCFNIDGDEFVIEPKVEDKITLLEQVAGLKDKTGSMKVFGDYLVTKFTEVSEDPDPELIRQFVYSNIEELIKQLTIGFKLAKAEDFVAKDPN